MIIDKVGIAPIICEVAILFFNRNFHCYHKGLISISSTKGEQELPFVLEINEIMAIA